MESAPGRLFLPSFKAKKRSSKRSFVICEPVPTSFSISFVMAEKAGPTHLACGGSHSLSHHTRKRACSTETKTTAAVSCLQGGHRILPPLEAAAQKDLARSRSRCTLGS